MEPKVISCEYRMCIFMVIGKCTYKGDIVISTDGKCGSWESHQITDYIG